MIASTQDLAPRGNYFGEGAYLSQDLERGTLHNRGGARMLALTDEALVAAMNTLERELGERAAPVVKAMGRDWGRRAAEQLAAELGKHYGRPLAQLPLALFIADVSEAFRRHGWGTFSFDLSRYAQGVLLVEVRDPFVGGSVKAGGTRVEGLLAAFLAGMFSHFAGLELDAVQTECHSRGAAASRFVLTVPERAQAAESQAADGRTAEEILGDLVRA